MYRLTVVYDEPVDKDAFNRRYTDEHVALVKASPGLVAFQLSHPQGGTPYLVAELFWDDEDAFKAWAVTPERAAVRNHAEGCGTTFTTFAGEVTELRPAAVPVLGPGTRRADGAVPSARGSIGHSAVAELVDNPCRGGPIRRAAGPTGISVTAAPGAGRSRSRI